MRFAHSIGNTRYAFDSLRELLARLSAWCLAPICILEQGRVAIGDEIGLALGAAIAIVLIGERPGRTDTERNCISNIRTAGLGYEQAACQLFDTVTEARRLQLTGVALKTQTRAMGRG